MGLIAVPADEYCVGYVLTHLRPHCLKELCATREGDIERRLQEVYDTIERARWAQIVRVALFATHGPSEPIAIAIVYRVAPAVAEFQCFSTGLWDLIALQFPRWFKREVVPVLVQNRINFAETNILAEGPANYRWLQLMGMFRNGDPTPCGINGELYQRVVWLREDFRDVRVHQADFHAARNGRRGRGADSAAGRSASAAEAARGRHGILKRGGGASLAAANGRDRGVT